MKPSYQILSVAALFLSLLSFGILSALNGVKSPKLPWQGTASGFYDSTHNVGSSYLADARFTLTGSNAVAIDSTTGLNWQSYYTGASATTYTWGNAVSYCANLNLGGYPLGTWRLPTLKELEGIADFSRINPGLNASYFWAQNDWYWTSTPLVTDATQTWVVNASNGDLSTDLESNVHYARCVHN